MIIDLKATTQVASLQDPMPGVARYWLYIKMGDMPLNLPLDPNPRDQNLATKVAQDIKASALDPDLKHFHLMNRGLLLIVTRAAQLSESGGVDKLRVWLDPSPGTKLGLGDGGTTYKVIRELMLDPVTAKRVQDKWLTVEVLAQIPSNETITQIVGSRNRSMQVKFESLLDHSGSFEFVKDTFRDTPYEGAIRYRENGKGLIEVRDFLLMLTLLNPTIKPKGKNGESRECHGTNVYGQPVNQRSLYETHQNSYEKFSPILKDIAELHDYIGYSMASDYNNIQVKQKKTRARNMSTIFVDQTPYGSKEACKKTPFRSYQSDLERYPRKALWFAIVGSLRSFVVDTGESFKFCCPVSVIKKLLQQNSAEIVNHTRTELQKSGCDMDEAARKNTSFWSNPYRIMNEARIRYMNTRLFEEVCEAE